MNQRAKLRSEPTLASPTASMPPSENDGVARPKVLRRPAHFSAPSAPVQHALPAPMDMRLDAPMRDTPASPVTPFTTRHWQDDGRFAVALLAIVIIVNVVVSVWLARMAPTQAPEADSQASIYDAQAPSTADVLLHELSEAGKAALEQ